jgi:multidrug efflux system outer membrane protein
VKRGALLSAALLLAGCAVGPDYKRPELQVPPEFRGQPPDVPASEKSIGDLAWWEVFQDPVLQELLRTALAANYDLRIATARVLDAQAQVTINRSFQFPDVTGNASAAYNRVVGDRAP